MGNTDAVRSVETAVQIVERIDALGGTATIAELDDHLPLAKSTIYKHLNTLRTQGYVVKSDDSYRFGLQLLELGGVARQYDGLYQVAKPKVREMAERTGEVANLAFEERGWGRYVYTVSGEQAADIDTHIGKRIPLHSTGLGKALLASLPEEESEAIIENRELHAQTEQTITDRTDLREEIGSIRAEDIAYDTEEHLRGMGCVAAPIRIPGRRHAAISVTGPVSRVTTDEMRDEYARIVRRAANVIELDLSSED